MESINKFNLSKIYVIKSPQTDLYYIGSTTYPLCDRFTKHKSCYKRYLKGTCPFVTSFKIIEHDDAYIELLEDVNCENRNQLEKRESELIKEHKTQCVNKFIPCRTRKEWIQVNSDKIKQYDKQYRIDNTDKIKQYYIDNLDKLKQYKKQYCIDNADKIKQYSIDNADKLKQYEKQYRIDNADKIKQYSIDNADKIKQYKKQYLIDNADKIKEKRRIKYAETK